MSNYKDLDSWKNAMQLVKEVYKIAAEFPKEEVFSLTSQTKRAAVSVPSNIAEGIGRQYKKDTIHFLHIARGSLYELETLIHLALLIGIGKEEEINNLVPLIEKNLQILNGLINYFQRADLK